MSRHLTASDRKSLIRLARELPKGDETRRAILSGLRLASKGWEYSDSFPGKGPNESLVTTFWAGRYYIAIHITLSNGDTLWTIGGFPGGKKISGKARGWPNITGVKKAALAELQKLGGDEAVEGVEGVEAISPPSDFEVQYIEARLSDPKLKEIPSIQKMIFELMGDAAGEALQGIYKDILKTRYPQLYREFGPGTTSSNRDRAKACSILLEKNDPELANATLLLKLCRTASNKTEAGYKMRTLGNEDRIKKSYDALVKTYMRMASKLGAARKYFKDVDREIAEVSRLEAKLPTR